MTRKVVVVLGVGICAWVAGGARVQGQAPVPSFEQLGTLVKPGDTITVVDATGTKSTGRIGLLSRESLTLTTPSGVHQLAEKDVAEIQQRRGDSLKNGAIIGAVSATAYYGIMGAIFHDMDGGEVLVGPAVAGGFVFAGVGAAAGAGIDALIRHRKVVYRGGTTQPRVTVAPLLGRTHRGATVSVRF